MVGGRFDRRLSPNLGTEDQLAGVNGLAIFSKAGLNNRGRKFGRKISEGKTTTRDDDSWTRAEYIRSRGNIFVNCGGGGGKQRRIEKHCSTAAIASTHANPIFMNEKLAKVANTDQWNKQTQNCEPTAG